MTKPDVGYFHPVPIFCAPVRNGLRPETPIEEALSHDSRSLVKVTNLHLIPSFCCSKNKK